MLQTFHGEEKQVDMMSGTPYETNQICVPSDNLRAAGPMFDELWGCEPDGVRGCALSA